MAVPTLAIQAIQQRLKAKNTASVLQKDQSNTILKVVLATGLGIGVFLGIRTLVRKTKRNIRERGALTFGNPATFATQLKMAFENDNAFGWGTDEEAVFRVLDNIPSASMMRKVQRAYRDLYNQNLAADLKDELSAEEYNAALDIINLKSKHGNNT